MRRWWPWSRRERRVASKSKRVGLSTTLSHAPGKWIAVDRDSNEPRLVSDSPYELAAQIRQSGMRNVAVVRAPDPREPELVGLG